MKRLHVSPSTPYFKLPGIGRRRSGYAGTAGCGTCGWTLAPSPGHREAPRPGEDERHSRAWQAKDLIWTWRKAKATKGHKPPCPLHIPVPGAQPQAAITTRLRPDAEFPRPRPRGPWPRPTPGASALPPAALRLCAPSGGHCACAPETAGRSEPFRRKGRGGAALPWPGTGECGVECVRRVRSRLWAPASGHWGSPVVGGALWRIWDGGRKRLLLNWMMLGVRDVWTGRSQQNGFKGKVRWFLLRKMLCEQCFSIFIILGRFVNLLLCHSKEARSLPLPNPANG